MRVVTYPQFLKYQLAHFDEGGKYALMYFGRTEKLWNEKANARGWSQYGMEQLTKTYRRIMKWETEDPNWSGEKQTMEERFQGDLERLGLTEEEFRSFYEQEVESYDDRGTV